MRSVIYSSRGHYTFATSDEAITPEDVIPTVRVLAQSPEVKRRLRKRLEELKLVTPLTYLREDKFLDLVAQTVVNGTFRILKSPRFHVSFAETPEAFAPPSKQPAGPRERPVPESALGRSRKASTQSYPLRAAAKEGVPFCQMCNKTIKPMQEQTSQTSNQDTVQKEERALLCENCKARELRTTVWYVSEDALWSASYLNKYADSTANFTLPIDLCIDAKRLIDDICELRETRGEEHPISIAAKRLEEKTEEAMKLHEKEYQEFLNNLQHTERFRAKYYAKVLGQDFSKNLAVEAALKKLEEKKKTLTFEKISATGKSTFKVANDARMVISAFIVTLGKCVGPVFNFIKAVIKIVEILRSGKGAEHCQKRQQDAKKILISSEYEPLQRLGKAEVEFWQITAEAIELDNGIRGILAVCYCACAIAALATGSIGGILGAIATFCASGTDWAELARTLGHDQGLPTLKSRKTLLEDTLSIIGNEHVVQLLAKYAGLEPLLLKWAMTDKYLWILLEDVPTLYHLRYKNAFSAQSAASKRLGQGW